MVSHTLNLLNLPTLQRILLYSSCRMILYPSFDERLWSVFERREDAHGIWTPSGLRYYTTNPRTLGGVRYDEKRIQKELVEKVMDILGDDAWLYAEGEGNNVCKLKVAWKTVT